MEKPASRREREKDDKRGNSHRQLDIIERKWGLLYGFRYSVIAVAVVSQRILWGRFISLYHEAVNLKQNCFGSLSLQEAAAKFKECSLENLISIDLRLVGVVLVAIVFTIAIMIEENHLYKQSEVCADAGIEKEKSLNIPDGIYIRLRQLEMSKQARFLRIIHMRSVFALLLFVALCLWIGGLILVVDQFIVPWYNF
ncbi:MAG TPA: hypothetical protein VHF05_00440 [Candidatus Paceibacterota bacterium]|jgi:hypothetical protein|nr:hypothetical protein [Candidatus Paceibacterota bacterium]